MNDKLEYGPAQLARFKTVAIGDQVLVDDEWLTVQDKEPWEEEKVLLHFRLFKRVIGWASDRIRVRRPLAPVEA